MVLGRARGRRTGAGPIVGRAAGRDPRRVPVFAIIQTQGRQFRVEPGSVIELDGTGDAGARVTFDQVLLVGTGRRRGDDRRPDRGRAPRSSASSSTAHRGPPRSASSRRSAASSTAAPQGHRSRSRACASPTSSPNRRPMPRHAARSQTSWQQKRTRQFPQRARQQLAAAGRQAARRQRRHRRLDPRAAARAQVPARAQRRPRQGRHALCEGPRHA